jgi:hypothetical protein
MHNINEPHSWPQVSPLIKWDTPWRWESASGCENADCERVGADSRPRQTPMNHATRESFFDELRQTLASRADVFD